jgi:CTP:molybdopterin cytidylyltransferase MocA
MRKALILAAGTATRMHPLTLDTPKCLVDLGGTSSLRYLVDTLEACGLDEVVVVVGFQAAKIEAAFAGRTRPRLRFVYNRHYDFHGCECSMTLAHEALEGAGSVLIVEGDLLMPRPLFQTILDHPAESAVLLRAGSIQPTRSVVALGRDGRVERFVYDQEHRDVYRFIPDRSQILGESLQVWKFGGAGLAALLAAFREFQAGLGAQPDPRNGLHSINQAAKVQPMTAIPVDTEHWINLNTVDDVARAKGAAWLRQS